MLALTDSCSYHDQETPYVVVKVTLLRSGLIASHPLPTKQSQIGPLGGAEPNNIISCLYRTILRRVPSCFPLGLLYPALVKHNSYGS